MTSLAACIASAKPHFLAPEDDWIDEEGNWGQKRTYPYFNGWIPGVIVTGRCKGDGKLLTNSEETRACSFYVTGYAAKKQGKHYNMSALLSRGHAFHLKHSAYVDDLRNDQRMLLMRLVNSVNREQELASTLVISYLMGWGDTFTSHSYASIYWSTFVSVLLRTFDLVDRR